MICLINDVISAVVNCQLQTLNDKIIIERDAAYHVGNHVVIFKITYNNTYYALRCYRRTPPNLEAIYGSAFLPKELCVESLGRRYRLDVVLRPWIEGITLREAVERTTTFKSLSDEWSRLALEIVEAEWAHGDLSGDNIVVDAEGRMSLIDFDSSYCPALSGLSNNNLGTKLFQSSRRSPADFNSRIDDFSIVLITVALRALAHDAELLGRYPLPDGLLLDGSQIRPQAEYRPLQRIMELAIERGDFLLYRLSRMLGEGAVYYEALPRLLRFAVDGGRLSEGLVESFCEDGLWGYCCVESGEQVIPPLFDKAYRFRGGVAEVVLCGRRFVINRCGEVL